MNISLQKNGLQIIILLLLLVLFPEVLVGQSHEGKVLSSRTNSGIGFVNVIITGRNIGTVADISGRFSIDLDNKDDNDSLRFSMIGYESKSIVISQFRTDSLKIVYLDPVLYNLQEVIVMEHRHKLREVQIGTPVYTNILRSGFAYNDLGSELGIKDHVKGVVRLRDMHLNVAVCTYDSVTYRLNIYKSDDGVDYKNILTSPVYISFSGDQVSEVLTFDLTEYSIVVEGDILVTLELYKDLGEGKLLFQTQYFKDYTYHRKTNDGKWTRSAGAIGLSLHGQKIR